MKDDNGLARGLGDVHRHFWLLRSVARSMNVDLSAAMAEGKLSDLDYAQMVTRCRGAGCGAACSLWLAQQQDHAQAAPAFCANADVLDGLKSPT